MKVYIPNSAFIGNINAFLSSIDPSDPSFLEINTNPKWFSIHPIVLAMIGALGKLIDTGNIKCNNITARSGHYIKRMGLFDFLGIQPQMMDIEEHESAGRMIPLNQIKTSDELDNFLKELVPLLHLQSEPKHAQAIQHIFSELIRNVLEHANSKYGAIVCAQYYKKSNRIGIGIADAGIGLKAALSQSYTVQDDNKAIQLALSPGITGTTRKPGGTEQNAGFGLFLIKSIAFASSDFFMILSGDKMYKLFKRPMTAKLKLTGDPFEERHSILQIPYWQGVAVGVDISLDQTNEFTTLLDVIYGFYNKSVSGKKKEKYKKPNFI